MPHHHLLLAPLAPLALLACCTPAKPPAPSATSAVASAQPPAAAQAAVGVAQEYFDQLQARRWREAHALWSPEVVGPLPAFVAVSANMGALVGKAGAPTAIRSTDGTDYVLVEAVTDTTDARHGTVRRYGVVMLKRPSGAERRWRIWGTDIRVRHCKAGEQPRGLGCIPG